MGAKRVADAAPEPSFALGSLHIIEIGEMSTKPRPITRRSATRCRFAGASAACEIPRAPQERVSCLISGSRGKVVAIRGAVVDLAFEGALPPIEDAVEIFDFDGRIVVAEIQAHVDTDTARAIALEPTNGLRRGDSARGAGGPVTVAVGESTLGRLMDVLGRIGDRGPPLPPDGAALADPPQTPAVLRPDRGRREFSRPGSR